MRGVIVLSFKVLTSYGVRTTNGAVPQIVRALLIFTTTFEAPRPIYPWTAKTKSYGRPSCSSWPLILVRYG